MYMNPAEWRKAFENKTELELKAMVPPEELPIVLKKMWGRDRDTALAAVREAQIATEDREDDQVLSYILDQKSAIEEALSALENDSSAGFAAAPGIAPQALEIPKGNAADLLEQQIATCAALIGNIANYIARSDTATDVCFPFMDRISSLLSSSATAARVVGQLRGIASETKQTFVKKVEGAREGGVPQT